MKNTILFLALMAVLASKGQAPQPMPSEKYIYTNANYKNPAHTNQALSINGTTGIMGFKDVVDSVYKKTGVADSLFYTLSGKEYAVAIGSGDELWIDTFGFSGRRGILPTFSISTTDTSSFGVRTNGSGVSRFEFDGGVFSVRNKLQTVELEVANNGTTLTGQVFMQNLTSTNTADTIISIGVDNALKKVAVSDISGGGNSGGDNWKLSFVKYRVPLFYLDQDTILDFSFAGKEDLFDTIRITAIICDDDFELEEIKRLKSLEIPNLDSVAGSVHINDVQMDSLYLPIRVVQGSIEVGTYFRVINMPNLSRGGGDYFLVSNSDLESLTVGASLSGFTSYSLSGSALSATYLDAFLAAIIAGGDDGGGNAIDISGGTNAAPNAGLVSTLQSMNWTVSHN